MFYADAVFAAGARLVLPADAGERAIYVVEGAVRAGEGDEVTDGRLAVLSAGRDVTLTATKPARAMLLGGQTLDGERHIWWNFVASSMERIEQAKRDWEADRFGRVPGDDERIPLPED
jgi:redox-sensitive bicupin YhaK (pirin superfamily)